MSEIDRLKDVYEKRNNPKNEALYSYLNPSALFIYQEREKALLGALGRYLNNSINESRILDIGCGYGNMLIEFLKYGALPGNCYGIDIIEERIETARKLFTNASFQVANAEHIPFDVGFFDIVNCSTVFSSILEQEMKRNVASEMLRVTSTSGLILWFDYHMNNPQNKDVRGIKKNEISDLFPGCDIVLHRIIPAPPLLRILAPHSVILCQLLQKLKFLNTHYFGVIRKKV